MTYLLLFTISTLLPSPNFAFIPKVSPYLTSSLHKTSKNPSNPPPLLPYFDEFPSFPLPPAPTSTTLQSSPLSSLPSLLGLPSGVKGQLVCALVFSYVAQILSALNYHKTVTRFIRWSYFQHISSLFLSSPSPITVPLGGISNVPTSGPLCSDLSFIPRLALLQPHRFLTSALVHGNLIHIFFNLSSILNLPSFLPSALGSGLFLATFLISTLTGNVAHMMTTPSTPVLGASGGICGLYGILYVLFSSSNRKQEAKVRGRNWNDQRQHRTYHQYN